MSSFNHTEAFCLMTYASEDRTIIEVLWNSRDGVTPFCILNAVGGQVELQHVNWRQDSYLRYNVPDVGSRVFIDATIEDHTASYAKFVERHWIESKMFDRYETKKEAIRTLAQHTFDSSPGGPWVHVVTPQMQKMFEGIRDGMERDAQADLTPGLRSA